MTQHLLIGGQRDGQWWEVPSHAGQPPILQLLVPDELPPIQFPMWSSSEVNQDCSMNVTLYRRVIWQTAEKSFRFVYIEQLLSDEEAFDKLLRGYHPASPTVCAYDRRPCLNDRR